MPPLPVFLGADLGGTNFRAGLRLPGSESLLDVEGVPSSGAWDAAELLRELEELLGGMRARHPELEFQIVGVGMGITGDIDFRDGICYSMKRFPRLEAHPLARDVEAHFGVPVRLLNDGLSAGLAELRAGAGRGVDDFVMVTLGTGIGGAVVMGGRLLTGSRGRVGKAGHQIVGTVKGPVHCHCGLNGCWQSLAGRDGIAARAREYARRYPDSELARLGVAGSPEAFDFRRVVTAAEAGDAASREVIAETGRWIGIGLANLVKLFAPEKVLVGGGSAQDNPLLFAAMNATVWEYAIKPYQRAPIAPAYFRKDAGVLGATFLAESGC